MLYNNAILNNVNVLRKNKISDACAESRRLVKAGEDKKSVHFPVRY